MKKAIGRDIIREDIFALQDIKYREFHSRLVPGDDTVIGVRIPVMRQYAKELCRDFEGSAEELIDIIGSDYQEEIMLKGMIIGMQKKIGIDRLLSQVEKFVPEIRNWAVCDVFCAGLKQVRKYPEETYEFLQKYFTSHEEFYVRFGIVMLINYYINEEYLERVLKKAEEISHEGYYVKMAVAWMISICFVKYYERTKWYMENCNLDDFTYNKALQKSIESRRLTQQQKECLKKMKRRI